MVTDVFADATEPLATGYEHSLPSVVTEIIHNYLQELIKRSSPFQPHRCGRAYVSYVFQPKQQRGQTGHWSGWEGPEAAARARF